MKIKKFRIKNYKSIKNSEWCYLASDITILAGKNESGKTGILEALRDFGNNIPSIPDASKPLDSNNDPMIEICFTPRQEIFDEITRTIGINSRNDIQSYISENGITIIKLYDGNYKLGKQFSDVINKSLNESNEKYIKEVKSILPKIQQFTDITQPNITENIIDTKQAINQYIKQLIEQDNSISEEEKKQKLNTYINKLISVNNNLQEIFLSNNFLEAIKKYIPKFIFFSDFQDMLNYEYALTDAQNVPIVKDFCKITNLDLSTVINTNDSQRRKIILRTHSAKISGNFQSYWKQDKLELVIELDGQTLNFCVKESEDTIVFKPEQRSKGFQWFLSFYLRLNAERSKTNIILIDEPGLYLHAKAQEDVLKVLKKISEESQVIFSTHSPYLIDSQRLDRVRLILKDDEKGTQIKNKVHALADKETLTPILTAIGLGLNSGITDFKKTNNVIVEGISDLYYLNAFKKIFDKNKMNFIFGGGAGNMPVVGTILHGWGCKLIYLYDKDKGQEDGKTNLKDNWFVSENLILSITDNEGDAIEDIFSENDFKKFVLKDENKEYNQSNSQYLKKKTFDKVLLAKQFLDSNENDKLDTITNKRIEKLFKKIETKFNNSKN